MMNQEYYKALCGISPLTETKFVPKFVKFVNYLTEIGDSVDSLVISMVETDSGYSVLYCVHYKFERLQRWQMIFKTTL